MIDASHLVSQSLAPAVAISASALLALGLINRVSTLGARIRQLNKEIRLSADPAEIARMQEQIRIVFSRAYFVRNALLCLFSAIALMVLTAFGLAFSQMGWLPNWTPVVPFLAGLAFIFGSVLFELNEVLMNLHALHIDSDVTLEKDVKRPSSFQIA
jgi:hypothetical protein